MLKQKSFIQKHNKTIKFSILAGVSLLANLLFCSPVFAAPGISGSVSSSSVTVGTSVTFTVSFSKVAVVNINMSGSGAGASCSFTDVWVEDNAKDVSKSFMVSCKPTTTGTITFKATGTCAGGNDSSASSINVTKTVTVKSAPASTQTQTQTTPTQTQTQTTDTKKDEEKEEEKEEEKKEEEAPKEEEQDENPQEGIGNIVEREGPDIKQILIYVFAGIAGVTSIALAVVTTKLIKCKKSQQPVASDDELDDHAGEHHDPCTKGDSHRTEEHHDSYAGTIHTDPYTDDKRPLGEPDEKLEQ